MEKQWKVQFQIPWMQKKAWLEAALEEGVEIHEPDSLEDYSGQFKLRIPRSLHRLLAEHSQREEISIAYIFFRGMMRYSQNSNYK